MTLGATLLASLLVTLVRPSTWALALLAFLLRGGFLLVLAPIVAVPSMVGVANVVAPVVTAAYLNGASGEVIAVIVVAGMLGLGWLLLAGWVAAAAEAEAIRVVAEDEEVREASGPARRPDRAGPRWIALGVLVVRILAWLPLGLALAVGAVRLANVAYRELTVPSAGGAPLIVRVIVAAPEAVGAIALAWVLGEVVGAVAARRVVLAGDGPGRALIGAVSYVVRHPIRAAVVYGLPTIVLILVTVPSVLATASAWSLTRSALDQGDGPLPAVLAVAVLVGLWTAWLVLLGVVTAWRTAAWTVDVARTFGGVETDQSAGWRVTPRLAP